MNSVLIHDMEIPKNCGECELCKLFNTYCDFKDNLVLEYRCQIVCKIMDYDTVHAGCRPKFCPMEEIEESYISRGTLEELKAQCAVPTLEV